MKAILFLFTLITCNLSIASEWNDRVLLYLEGYKKSVKNPKPIVYPKLAERINSLFSTNSNNYIKIEEVKNKKRTLSTELYYSEGQLVIRQYHTGWNLVTKGNQVYEWEYGKKTGIKFEKNDNNLVDYILYLTDPTYIMTSLYNKYNTNPELYDVKEHSGKPYKELSLLNPLYGFEAIFVNLDSLWFHGFKLTNPKTKKTITSYYSLPKKYQSLPVDIKKEMNSVKFEQSKLTVKRHMAYL